MLALAPEIGGIGVTIDGFNTTGGNSDGAATITVNSQIVFRGSGGAIYTDFGTNTLTNNTIYGNNADHGGGISTSNGTNTLTNNTIYENNADHGGGISTSNGTYTLTNNTIYGNNAVNNGGGISTSDGTNALTNNTIYGNNAVNNGGGIFTWNSTWTGTNTLTTNNIYENSATNGGGIFIYIGYNTVVSKNVINYNTAEFGGGIFVYAGGSNTIENNSLHNNIANEYGGLYIYYSYTNTIVNNTFYNNNSIEEAGGALYTTSGSNQIYNNIFWNNQFNGNATIAGADYEYGGEASANDFRNNMLQLPNNTTNYPTTGGTTYTNNIYATDPLFVNPTDPDGPDNLHRTADDGLSIQPCSPAINAGTPTGAPTEDITGATRLSNPDIGAYENNPSVVSIVYVKHNATGLNDGTSWTNAFTSLQSALQAAHTCPGIDEVWVAEGTYKPSAYPHGCTGCASARDYTFHLRDGLKIYGGFVGTETSLSARTIAAHPTILSGDFIGDDIVTGSGATLSITGNSENARHVVLAVAPEIGGIGVTIDGFRVTGGNGGGGIISVSGVEIFGSSGGGLATYFGDNNIFNSVITGNNAPATGGGMYNHIGIYNISNNIIYKNMSHHGGGLTNYHCTSNLNNNTIYENNSSATGGGIDINYSTNTLTNNVFFENFSLYGGGIDVAFSNATMINNSIFKNVAAHQGGGISSWQSNCSFSNNTIYKNNSNEKGSGIYTTYGNNTIQNNIFWANQKGGNTTVAGADYENHSSNPSTNIFENNMLQLPNNTTNYPTTGGTTAIIYMLEIRSLSIQATLMVQTISIALLMMDWPYYPASPAVDNGTTTRHPSRISLRVCTEYHAISALMK
ncbi:MAG: right-handed parallel beta-helix repeat-containing protein [Saprospiraceae bacterium]